MRGFLQRLVEGVARPQVRLHPLSEPMFAPRARGVSAEMPALLEVSESVMTPGRVVARQTGEVEQGADTGSRSSIVRESSVPIREAGGFEPLMDEAGFAASEESVSVGDDVAGSVARASVPMATDEEKPAPADVSMLAAESLPLMPLPQISLSQIVERLTQRSSEDSSSIANVVPTARAARGVGPAPVREKAAQRMPDEIQIHIGRIEVIAAPPPAPRVPSVPERKAMSLDEYLSRRDGRVG